jgi:hypothetical protein
MLIQSIPEGNVYSFVQARGVRLLPAFVAAHLMDLANWYEWNSRPDGDFAFQYHELYGCAGPSLPQLFSEKEPIHFALGARDRATLHVYVGGAPVWIEASSKDLSTCAIPAALVPEPDPATWWAIEFEQGVQVYKIAVLPDTQVRDDFPDV